MLAGALLAASLAIVGYGWWTGKGFAGRIAALAGPTSRARMIVAWAAGTWVTYGLSSLLALILLGQIDAVATMPPDLQIVAWRFGLSGGSDAGMLLWLGACLAAGVVAGVAVLALRNRLGKRPIGLAYRSPAAARVAGERLPAALLALSAGVSEGLFFRLLLPLLVALVFGSAALGYAVSLVAFAALHGHQGRVGMIAVTLVGAWLTYLYLLTGALWVVVLLHVLIDLHALVLRPRLAPAT
ncbi:type II CAAX prenyl endopeptidase Rce1 family protein [Sphingomonas sp.]|uniref:CPBP family glutamic-type intramembrane protease n=1 Tax=Sphingomonas sp. TaxID=28214 RepID=UPI0035BC8E74